MNWDDFRYVLALARGGTLTRAASSLGVHYTSVARRIAQAEASLGTQLFHHGRRDHVLTEAGEELVRVAERMEDEVFALDRELLGKDATLSGTLRVGMVGSMARALGADLAEFADNHPDIDLQLTCGLTMHSLTRREADVAVRASASPGDQLVGRRVSAIQLAPYAHKALVARMEGRPWSEWPWVRMEDRVGGTMGKEWLDAHAPGWSGPFLLDDWDVMEHHIATGVLAGMSATGMERVFPDLVRLADPMPFSMSLWVLTHPDLRHTARVRAFMRFISGRLKRLFDEPGDTTSSEP
ncbi:MAG: LysR family transcriptional regulator [Proteobacteria bacterium]|nr:LysR family transcriptional regulator [Pseudomonadota bacterium]